MKNSWWGGLAGGRQIKVPITLKEDVPGTVANGQRLGTVPGDLPSQERLALLLQASVDTKAIIEAIACSGERRGDRDPERRSDNRVRLRLLCEGKCVNKKHGNGRRLLHRDARAVRRGRRALPVREPTRHATGSDRLQ